MIRLIKSRRPWDPGTPSWAYSGDQVTNVEIKRENFQRDSLSPFLFVTALIPLQVILGDAGQGVSTGKESEPSTEGLW